MQAAINCKGQRPLQKQGQVLQGTASFFLLSEVWVCSGCGELCSLIPSISYYSCSLGAVEGSNKIVMNQLDGLFILCLAETVSVFFGCALNINQSGAWRYNAYICAFLTSARTCVVTPTQQHHLWHQILSTALRFQAHWCDMEPTWSAEEASYVGEGWTLASRRFKPESAPLAGYLNGCSITQGRKGVFSGN